MTAYVYRGRKRDANVDLIAANAAVVKARPVTDQPVAKPRHGTQAGVNRHRKLHQRPCKACQALETARKNQSRLRLATQRHAELIRMVAEGMFGDDEAQRAARRAALAEAIGVRP